MPSIGSRGKSFIFHPRNLVVLVAAAIVFVLRWKYHLSLLSFLLFFVLPILVYYLVPPLVARKRFPEFERQIRMMHMKGRWKEALDHYRRNVFLRAFGPAPDMKRLLGQINAFLFKWESACRAFEESLDARGGSPDLPTLAGYAEACFHTGRDREAEKALSRLADSRIHLPGAAYHRVHLFLEDEKKKKEAARIFEETEWSGEKDEPTRLLVLSEIQAEKGRPAEALDTLGKVSRKKLDAPLRHMARLLEARLLLMLDREKEAKKILSDIERHSPPGRHLLELEDFEEVMGDGRDAP